MSIRFFLSRLLPGSEYPILHTRPLAHWISFRHYIGILRQDYLLESLQKKLKSSTQFEVLDVQPHMKDGGVYVKIAYSPTEDIERVVREEVERAGGIPSWHGLSPGNVWLMKGTPWKEVSFNALPTLDLTRPRT